jgi:SPP1 gp7 family putative phage head morphogenesis protein
MPDEVTLKPLPFDEALRALRRRLANLVPSYAWQDLWEAEHARAFTVAKGMSDDVLKAVADAVEKALADGETFAAFKKQLEPRLRELGWWGRQPMTDPRTGETREVQLGSPHRLQIIFDTNMRVSHAAGKWEQVQRLKDVRPYLRYVAVLDNRTRAAHRAWHGTILPVDHPFWDTHYPPNGWNCRCTVMSASARDLERNGWTLAEAAPAVEYRNWVNKRTGQVERVPAGIDPGFAYNPGAAALAAEE